MLRSAAVLVLWSLLTGPPVAAQPGPPSPFPADSVRAMIARLVDSAGLASLAVAVARDGHILWEAGFGFADVERRVPATSRTVYSVASVSKPYTATGIMKLAELGKLDLDRPANDYLRNGRLTGLAGPAEGATVRRILSHTAGLPLHARFFYDGAPEKRPTMKEAIDRYGILVFPPGEVYNYANLGYGVLEQIIADVSGRSFESFMEAEIFAPLGLAETTIGSGAGIRNAAIRYDGAKRPIPFYDFDHRGASAVWASARDLVRFGMFHLRQPSDGRTANLLADSTLALMQRAATPAGASRYGLGWSLGEEGGRRVASHSGGMPGVVAYLILFPDDGVVVAAVANQGDTGIPRRAATLMAAAANPQYDRGATERRARERPAATAGFQPPDSLLGEWSGWLRTYDEQRIPVELVVKPGDVHARLVTGRLPLWTVVNQPSFTRGFLSGTLMATVPTEEALRYPQVGFLSLLHSGGKLRGYLVAAWVLDRSTAGMPSYVELSRKTEPSTAAPP